MQGETDHQHQQREPDDDHREHLIEADHLARQRRLQRLHLRDQAVDPPELGGWSSRDDQAQPATGSDQGSRIGHAMTVANPRVRRDLCRDLVGWDGFPGQRRFINAQVDGLEQAQIGRHPVARTQPHDVAWHQRLGGDLDPVFIAPDMGVRRKHLADAFKRLFRFTLLNEADDGVDQNHREDDGRVDPVSEQRSDPCRRDQDIDEQVIEVLEETLEQAILGRSRQPVRTDLRQTFPGLRLRQPLAAALQCNQNRLD